MDSPTPPMVRAARLREQRRAQRVWSDEEGGWVAPFVHVGSDYIYTSWGCQCRGCLDAHAYANRLRRIANNETLPITRESIDLANRVLSQPPTIPPPPPPGATTGSRHERRRGRHRRRT